MKRITIACAAGAVLLGLVAVVLLAGRSGTAGPDVGDTGARDAAWTARACAAAEAIRAEQTPGATRRLDFDLRHATDAVEVRAIMIAHLDRIDRRTGPVIGLLRQQEAPARVAARRAEIVEALDTLTAARGSVLAAPTGTDAFDGIADDARYHAEEVEAELLSIACPPSS